MTEAWIFFPVKLNFIIPTLGRPREQDRGFQVSRGCLARPPERVGSTVEGLWIFIVKDRKAGKGFREGREATGFVF